MLPEEFIRSAEGLSGLQPDGTYKAAWDAIGGVWTIGPGITVGVTKNTHWTGAQVDAALHKELTGAEDAVKAAVKVPLTSNEFAALVSLAYNIGVGAFKGSTLLKLLNKSNFNDVPGQFMRWVYAKKKRIPGLVNRREAEVKLWQTPDHDQDTARAVMAAAVVPIGVTVPQRPQTEDNEGASIMDFFKGFGATADAPVSAPASTPAAGVAIPKTNTGVATVTIPVSQSPLVESQFSSLLRGVLKAAGGAALLYAQQHWGEVQSLAYQYSTVAGIASFALGQYLSFTAHSTSNSLTKALVASAQQPSANGG